MTKEDELMDFLHKRVFDPILESKNASPNVKSGVNLTIARMNKLSADKMVQYFWSSIAGENGIMFSEKIKADGLPRFADIIDEFKERFDDDWIMN